MIKIVKSLVCKITSIKIFWISLIFNLPVFIIILYLAFSSFLREDIVLSTFKNYKICRNDILIEIKFHDEEGTLDLTVDRINNRPIIMCSYDIFKDSGNCSISYKDDDGKIWLVHDLNGDGIPDQKSILSINPETKYVFIEGEYKKSVYKNGKELIENREINWTTEGYKYINGNPSREQ